MGGSVVGSEWDHELKVKSERVAGFLERVGCDGLLLNRQANFAWATGGGDNHVAISTEWGASSVLFARGRRYLLTSNIEGPRVMQEELAEKGFEPVTSEWHHPSMPDLVQRLVPGGRIAADGSGFARDVTKDLVEIRAVLTDEEVRRYRILGRRGAASLEDVARRVRAGLSEFQIAGMMADAVLQHGITPTVLLVAVDERIDRFRHPIPTTKAMDRRAMLILCARCGGLVISLTRIVHHGAVPAELRRKHDAVTRVDAAMILATIPGTRYADVLERAREEYSCAGYADEWTFHHQGGPTGYQERDEIVTPDSDGIVRDRQAFAWNPSIRGTKSEDTMLVNGEGYEVITASPAWPTTTVRIDSAVVERPDILVM